MNDFEILTLEAFLAALANQVDPLPEAIQQRLQAIGENLAHHVGELDQLAEAHPPLDVAYQFERLALQRQGGQRQKRMNMSNDGNIAQQSESPVSIAKAIFCSDNSVLTTQKIFRQATDDSELVLTPSNGSPDSTSYKIAPTAHTANTTTSPAKVSATTNSIPAQPSAPGIQRIVLAANANDRDRQNYHQYLEDLKRLNPKWQLVPDRPQLDEADAYLLLYQDENYAARHAAHIATRYINDFFQNIKL